MDIGMLSMEGDHEWTPLLQEEEYAEVNPQISPVDGRWMAYTSDESDQQEVYVRPFPDIDTGRWQVSTSGGSQPLWARSGEELFYLAPDGAVLRVAVDGTTTFKAGTPTQLFQGPYFSGTVWRTYDVSPDGQRFLMIKEGFEDENFTPPSLIVVQNWFEELKRLAPTN